MIQQTSCMQKLIHAILFLSLTSISLTANSQHLFGNPSCANWLMLPHNEKTTWLNAFLVPLNLTNVSRKKPKEDKFSKLPSLDPVVSYVDIFCEENQNEFASLAAVKFLDKLTSGDK
jgi:hypothetical protein